MAERNLQALDLRHTLPNLKNLLLTLTSGATIVLKSVSPLSSKPAFLQTCIDPELAGKHRSPLHLHLHPFPHSLLPLHVRHHLQLQANKVVRIPRVRSRPRYPRLQPRQRLSSSQWIATQSRPRRLLTPSRPSGKRFTPH